MKKAEAVKSFKTQYRDLYLKKVDFWTAHMEWTIFIDTLCRNGKITQNQFNTWLPPFKYGKHLNPSSLRR